MNDATALSSHAYQVRIRGLIERSRYEQASAVLGEALGRYPDDCDLLVCAALIDFQHGDLAAALRTLEGALLHDPQHEPSRWMLLEVHEALEDLAAAEEVLLGLLRDDPDSAALFARYAMLMYRALHVDKARALAREAIRLDPENESALTAIAMGDLIDGRESDQRASLAALVQKHPEDFSTAHMLVMHLLQRGRFRAAKRIAVELLKAQPDAPGILEMVVELEVLSHWSMLPLWPLLRWGVPATITLWLGWLLTMHQLRTHAPAAAAAAGIPFLGFCILSWVYPPLLRYWLRRRAGL